MGRMNVGIDLGEWHPKLNGLSEIGKHLSDQLIDLNGHRHHIHHHIEADTRRHALRDLFVSQ